MKIERPLVYSLLSELLFTILPLIIVIIIRGYENKYELIFYNTEWSIMAIILFGQSIVKFSSGISNSNRVFRWQLVSLIISIIIVFGLVPSIIVMVINLTNETKYISMYLIQMFLCILSFFTYFIVGYLGQKLLDENNKR